MVIGTKNEETLHLFVPVASYAAEYGCAIQEAVCGYADFCLRKRHDLPLKKRMLREIHYNTSRNGIGPALTTGLYLMDSASFPI